MYLDRMKYTESHVPSEGHKYTFSGKCDLCGDKKSVSVKGPDLFKFRQGEYIQSAFPYLTSGDREFLISGTCDKCWDKMWGEEDND